MTPGQKRLATLRALWEAERVTTRERFAAQRRGVPLKERVRRGVSLVDLSIDETDGAPGGRTLLWLVSRTSPKAFRHLRIRVGDPVRLWWDDPDGDDVTFAVVSRRQALRIAVTLDGDVPERLYDGGFRLDVDDPDATFIRGLKAIAAFAEAPAAHRERSLREVLLGEDMPSFDPLRP